MCRLGGLDVVVTRLQRPGRFSHIAYLLYENFHVLSTRFDNFRFVSRIGVPQLNLTHSVYRPLVPLIRKLASILVVDRQGFRHPMFGIIPSTSMKHFSA